MARYPKEHPEFTTYGLSCVRWIPRPMQRPDHHNEMQLNLLIRGRVTYLLGGRTCHVRPGRLTAFWAAIPHQIIDYEPNTDYFVATLPLAWFLQSRLPDLLVQPLMRGELVEDPGADRSDSDAWLFRQWAQDLSAPIRKVRDIVTAEMETRLRRLALGLETAEGASPRRQRHMSGLNRVEQMVCYVAQNYMEPITADDISRAAGMHPNSAMRLFKKTFGTTLVEHITHHRVFHAKRLLATTDQKIVDVAFSSGFNSISRFNEAFRRACGCTPRAFRAEHEQGEAQVAAG